MREITARKEMSSALLRYVNDISAILIVGEWTSSEAMFSGQDSIVKLFKGSIEGWLVIEGHVGTADFASRQSG